MEIKKTFHDAAKQGDLAAIGAHLSEQSDVNATDKLHRTPLHLAAWAGQKEAVAALLEVPGINIKATAVDDMTALHFAAQNGHTDIARMLITAGHVETVELLLKRKANPYVQDKKHENALDKAATDEIRAAVQSAIDAATNAKEEASRRNAAQPSPATQAPTDALNTDKSAASEMGNKDSSVLLERSAESKLASVSDVGTRHQPPGPASAPLARPTTPMGTVNSAKSSLPRVGLPKRPVATVEQEEEDDSIVLKRPLPSRPQTAAGPRRVSTSTAPDAGACHQPNSATSRPTPPPGTSAAAQPSVLGSAVLKQPAAAVEVDEEDDSIVLKRPPPKRPQPAAGSQCLDASAAADPQRMDAPTPHGSETLGNAAADPQRMDAPTPHGSETLGTAACKAPVHGDAPVVAPGAPGRTEKHAIVGMVQRPLPAFGQQSRR